ncbi:DUF6221 family protein [Streptomyces parvulus]|uniref:DUF6221 family protein n=1 Tax=Streptomyces parvulus TaxID=146923 RepID=UPI0033B6C766
MDDLVQWLRAQLDEDERIANHTGQPSTSWQNFDMRGELRDDHSRGTVAYCPLPSTRRHIARHDPARVLLEIDADRALLKEYASAQAAVDANAHPDMYDVGRAQGLEEAVRRRASARADRPGYQESWRP